MRRALIPVHVDQLDGSKLCLECGLCCDGSIFRFVNLAVDEQTDAVAYGADVVVRQHADGSRSAALRQPCVLHQGGCCSTYQQWIPSGCSSYRCRLLDGYTSGELSIEECREVIGLYRDTATGAADDELSVGVLEVLDRQYFKTSPAES